MISLFKSNAEKSDLNLSDICKQADQAQYDITLYSIYRITRLFIGSVVILNIATDRSTAVIWIITDQHNNITIDRSE